MKSYGAIRERLNLVSGVTRVFYLIVNSRARKGFYIVHQFH